MKTYINHTEKINNKFSVKRIWTTVKQNMDTVKQNMDTVKQKPGHSDTEKHYTIALHLIKACQARTWTTFFNRR